MKVYILSDYEEHGAENVVATLDPSHLHNMIGAWSANPDWIASAQQKLAETSTDPGKYNLHDGWGGMQLHIVELE